MENLRFLFCAHPCIDVAEIGSNLLSHIHNQRKMIIFPEKIGALIEYRSGETYTIKRKSILQCPAGKLTALRDIGNLPFFHQHHLIIHDKLRTSVNNVAQHIIRNGTFRINPRSAKGILIDIKKIEADFVHKGRGGLHKTIEFVPQTVK